MDNDKDGFEWYSQIPFYYFGDKHKREYICRYVHKSEIDIIYDMYKEFEPKRSIMGVPPEDPEELEKWVKHFFDKDTKNIAVVDPKSKVIGHAALFPMNDKCCEYFMALLPTNQSVGIGRFLCVSVIETAKYMGYEKLWICVEKTNIRAILLHRKLGYKSVGGGIEDDLELELVVENFTG